MNLSEALLTNFNPEYKVWIFYGILFYLTTEVIYSFLCFIYWQKHGHAELKIYIKATLAYFWKTILFWIYGYKETPPPTTHQYSPAISLP